MMDHLERLRAPATALIIAASLNGIIGILALRGGLVRRPGLSGSEQLSANEAERIAYLSSTVITYGISLLSLLLAPLVIYGAVQMMRGRNYKMARVSGDHGDESVYVVLLSRFHTDWYVGDDPAAEAGRSKQSSPVMRRIGILPPQPPQSW